MRIARTTPALALAVLAACGEPSRTGDDGSPDGGGADGGDRVEVPFCTGATSVLYDPLSKEMAAFPDDYWTEDDAASATGLRVKVKPNENFAVPPHLSRFGRVYADLSLLDGFGSTAPITLRFSGALDATSLPADGATGSSASVVVVKLGASPAFVPAGFSIVPESANDPAATLVVNPLVPLDPKARYAVAVTNRVKDAAGGCIAPSATMKSLLEQSATDPALTRLHGRYAELLAALQALDAVQSKGELSAALVFTTQHTVEDSVAVATDIRTRTFSYTRGTCSAGAGSTQCEGKFGANDYRTNRILDEKKLEPQVAYDLDVTVWLPASGTKPYPTIVFGHGLGGDRSQGQYLAQAASAGGYAVVAIDAIKHGTHPDKATPMFGVDTKAMEFFGINAGALVFGGDVLDTRKFRDNLRQSTYDKLQLVELLRAGLDVDGDGSLDVGHAQLWYYGVSLGGIMAPELLALAPEIRLAITSVPGAQLTSVMRDSPQFRQAVQQARGQATDGELARFFPLVQMGIDRGDPAAYGRHVLHSRLAGFDAATPQFLMQMAIGDEIVPNPANAAYARALGLPLAGDELLPLGVVPKIAALPASGNVRAGLTAGVFQFDVVGQAGATQPATHNGLPASEVAFAQVARFLGSHLADGAAEIIDPYRTLGIKQ